MGGIWVISDRPEIAYELLSKANELKKQLTGPITAYVIGNEKTGQNLIGFGADKAKLMELPKNALWEQYIPVLVEEAKSEAPEIILIGATRRGKDFAAQLGALLDSPCITECKGLTIESGKVVAERMVYGGLAVTSIEIDGFPVIATIAARSYEKVPSENKVGEITMLDAPSSNKVKVIERRPKPQETLNINDANIVVGVGRGFSDQGQLNIAEDLAQALGGVVGCSRPIAEDLHWLPEDRYIGISGQVIKPAVYLAAGISGQIQHIYGVRDAKVIVAVDKNENSPIFQVADYYIVGDLEEVLPAIKDALNN